MKYVSISIELVFFSLNKLKTVLNEGEKCNNGQNFG